MARAKTERRAPSSIVDDSPTESQRHWIVTMRLEGRSDLNAFRPRREIALVGGGEITGLAEADELLFVNLSEPNVVIIGEVRVGAAPIQTGARLVSDAFLLPTATDPTLVARVKIRMRERMDRLDASSALRQIGVSTDVGLAQVSNDQIDQLMDAVAPQSAKEFVKAVRWLMAFGGAVEDALVLDDARRKAEQWWPSSADTPVLLKGTGRLFRVLLILAFVCVVPLHLSATAAIVTSSVGLAYFMFSLVSARLSAAQVTEFARYVARVYGTVNGGLFDIWVAVWFVYGVFGLARALRAAWLSIVAAAFFCFWGLVLMGLWGIDHGTIPGLGDSPRLGTFFYGAVNLAFANTPADFAPTTPAGQAVMVLEIVTGAALVTAYAGRFFGFSSADDQSARG